MAAHTIRFAERAATKIRARAQLILTHEGISYRAKTKVILWGEQLAAAGRLVELKRQTFRATKLNDWRLRLFQRAAAGGRQKETWRPE
jgi:hypothetical protein